MLGMEMMLKSMGLDPAAITQSVQEFGALVIALKEQMDRIENKLDAIAFDNSGFSEDAAPLTGSIEPVETVTLEIAGV